MSFQIVSKSSKDKSEAKHQSESKDDDDAYDRDEIREYVSARYLSAPECAWSIFGFRAFLHSKPVVRLPVHLPGEQSVVSSAAKPHKVPAALRKSRNTALTE